jgi:broad specificity phosphatase PhoE
VYLCRHAEATHNIKEREAVQAAIARGVVEKSEQEKCRRAVLDDESLKDAPLSSDGHGQVRTESGRLCILNAMGTKYPSPKLVLVSPLRRALMTATELFSTTVPKPKFVALEALREKRTGFFADERSSVDILEKEFPHIDFSDLRVVRNEIMKGEDNVKVRARGQAFLNGPFALIVEDSVSVVTHKGWLRELRHTLKGRVETGDLRVDFDLDKWDQTLYKNAEIRVAKFGWEEDKLTSIVSRSVENAIGSVVEDTVKHLIEKGMNQARRLQSTTSTCAQQQVLSTPLRGQSSKSEPAHL